MPLAFVGDKGVDERGVVGGETAVVRTGDVFGSVGGGGTSIQRLGAAFVGARFAGGPFDAVVDMAVAVAAQGEIPVPDAVVAGVVVVGVESDDPAGFTPSVVAVVVVEVKEYK